MRIDTPNFKGLSLLNSFILCENDNYLSSLKIVESRHSILLPIAKVQMNEYIAFSLAFVASLGTFIGGILVCLLALFGGHATSSNSLIGILQAGSAGVMLYMVFLDLVPESIEKIGQYSTMVYFFVGVAIFALLETLVSDQHDHTDDHHESTFSDSEETSSRRPGLRKRKSTTAKSKAPSKKESREKQELKRMGMVCLSAQSDYILGTIHSQCARRIGCLPCCYGRRETWR